MGNQVNLQKANDLQKKIVTQLTGLKLNEDIFCLNVCLDEEKNDFLNTIIIDVKKKSFDAQRSEQPTNKEATQ